MRHLEVCLLGAFLALEGAPAAASTVPLPDETAEIANWIAPPYWKDAHASERRALASGPIALPFISVFPCRLVDTRGNGAPLTGGFLPPATVRSYTLTGVCNIPADAQAISLNVTVVHPTGPGFLTIYPEGGAFPPVSTLNYLGNDVIVNAAVVPLSATGGISLALGVSGGDVILDTNGYYAPSSIVSSLSGLTGNVTLAAGPNVTIASAGGTLTINAPLTGLNAANVTSGILGVGVGGTGATSAAGARLSLGAAAGGANADITSLAALATPLSLAQGGTGSTSPFQNGFQARLTGACAAGQSISSVTPSGDVICGSTLDQRPLFTRTQVDASAGQYCAMTLGVDGLGLVGYRDASNHLRVSHCSDMACSSALISTIDATGNVGIDVAITIGSDGLGLLSYRDEGSAALKIAHCDDVACTSATLSTPRVTIFFPPSQVVLNAASTSIAIGADGLGLISFRDLTATSLRTAHCLNVACSAVGVSTIDNTGDAGTDSSIAIGADGLGLISYAIGTSPNFDIWVAHCTDVACTTATKTLLASGIYTSVTIGADGFGLIAYWHNSIGNFGLYVIHCNNAACTSSGVAPVDIGGADAVGTFPSVTVGADGLGLIAYRNQTIPSLKVAHCANIACSSAATTTVDVGGADTSITIGNDGFGLVAAFASSTNALRVVHCGNTLCSPFGRRR